MKRFVYLALAMLMPGMLLAAPVKKDAAKMKAAAFLQQKIAATSGRRAPQNLSLTSSEEEGSAYYVFKNGNKGFAIVAGDDRFGDVIGYSEENTFDEANMPEALRLTLQDYAAAVKFAQENNIEVKKGPRKAERASVTPFMEYEWNQSAPYCNQAPASGSASHASLGCMPVTVSMIVAHFKYPETLPAAYNGNYTNPATAYDYSKFKKSYSKTATSLDDVDMFMYHIANLLGTNYSESSAQESVLLPTLKNTLRYNKNMKSVMRDAYNATDWEEIIYNELAAKRPVNFLGSHPSLGGHSYLADGYRASDGFFHILWGWGNTCVGYFDMDVLNPFVEFLSSWGGLGYNCPPAGFTSGLKAIIGIQPTDTEGVTERLITVDDIIKDGSTSVRADMFNYGNETYQGKLSWAFLNADETFSKIKNAPEISISYSSGRPQYTTLNIANLNLTDGSYKLVLISKTNEEGADWTLCECYSQKYVEVEVANGQLIIIPHPVKDVKVETIVYKGYTGDYLELIMKLNNLGDDVFGFMNISVTRDDNYTWDVDGVKHPIGSTMDIALKKGESKLLSVFVEHGGSFTSHTYDVNVQYMKKDLGTYTINPSVYVYDSNSYYSQKPSYYLEYTGVEFEDYEYKNGNAYLYNTTLKGVINVKNTHSGKSIDVPARVTLKDENNNVVYQTTVQKIIAKGATVGVPIAIPGLEAGKVYKMTAEKVDITRASAKYTEATTPLSSAFVDFPINVTVAIPYYSENGTSSRIVIVGSDKVDLPENSAAVDFRTFSSDLVNLNSITNDNCVFVFETGADVPAELSGKNVVVGGFAEKITLTDGKPVVFPVEFTADEISYTRIFEKGNNGDDQGWQTIVLPFNAKVTVDGNPQDWFHSKSENGLKFWLFKYTNGVGGTVYFDFETANTMTANEPYLIAVPGNKWGEKYNLTNQVFTFKGTNVTVKGNVAAEKKGGEYIFNGAYTLANCTNGYKLNENGDFFELQTKDATELPFRAYFANANESTNNAARVLRVARSETDGIVQLEIDELTNENQPIYNLNGQRMQQMKRGVNIVGGKKVLVK